MVSNIGQETLDIYLSHSIFIGLISRNFVALDIKTGYSVLYLIPSIMYGIIFWYISILIKKNRITAFLLLGKK